MSAILLSFPIKSARNFAPSRRATKQAPSAQRAELNAWLATAAGHGWFLIEPTTPPDEPCFTIGHRAVDEEGIFQLCQDFDGWEVLSRRGQLLVYPSLSEALASICPVRAEHAA